MSLYIAPMEPSPISTHLPNSLTFLSNPISYYFNAAPPYNNVVLGALLFTPPVQTPRLLLLQKAGGMDPNAFSHTWQLPSGSPKPSDPTMLHALARIISEQTGLRLTNVSMMAGIDIELARFGIGKAQRMKMLLVVEVVELGSVHLTDFQFGKSFADRSQELNVDSVPILSRSGSYKQHVWSTEEDLKEFINSGLYPFEEKAQYRMMLEAFVFQKQNLAYLHSLGFDKSDVPA